MLIFIGVGPGDPELMTLKAVRTLREADAVALADKGAALQIAESAIEGKPILKLSLPMKGNRADWEADHREAARQLLDWLKTYPTIAYPVLGDPGVYASSSYLMRLIRPHHPCAVIPGIPAMCAAAAALAVPLCEQRESLTVLDNFQEDNALPEGNAVIMKSGRNIGALRRAAGNREAYAVRNLGMENEWMGKLSDMPEADYSYFTTVIVKAGEERSS